jgi:Tol biopolymer transport system component
VVFDSGCSGLVSGDGNDDWDVFVRDRLDDLTLCVSVTPTGAVGDEASQGSVISSDGRYVAFQSFAGNLVPEDADHRPDVFVRDLEAGAAELVSIGEDGEQLTGDCWLCTMTADGRYVLFQTGACEVLFARDRELGVTERVSWHENGDPNGHAWGNDITPDGRFVLFRSEESYVLSDTNSCRDVFVRDRILGTVERVSIGTDGEEGDQPAGGVASISNDGRYVAFSSDASTLVPGDTNGCRDVFLRDRELGTTTRISLDAEGNQLDADSGGPTISGDGRYVAFHSEAEGVVPSHTPVSTDIFVWDRQTDTTELASISTAGEPADDGSWASSISEAGRFVVFTSSATNLVPGDTNEHCDVFIRDRGPFSDVTINHWAYHEVCLCYDSGIVQGYPDGDYHPDDRVTRDQLAVYVARGLAGGDDGVPGGPEAPSFSDVGPEHWAYRYIEYGSLCGVIQGYPEGDYRPDLLVDRAQMAVYVARARDWVDLGDDMTTAPEQFPDVPAGHWAGTAIQACVDHGVVQGYPDGAYRPDDGLTRDQMAVYIARGFALGT